MICIIKMGAAFGVICFVINYNLKIDNNNLIEKNKSLLDTIERLKYSISKRDKLLNKEKELNKKQDLSLILIKNESFEDLGLLE